MPIQKDIFIDNYLQALNNGDAAIFAGAGLSVPSGCVNCDSIGETVPS